MTQKQPNVLWDADFDRNVKSYYRLGTTLIFTLTIVLIPLAILYFLIAPWFIEKHLKNLRCVLTDRKLEIKKGIFNKVESTIPLEKITDLQMFQGPIMRHYGLHGFKVETAGQSGVGSLVNIIGIVDAVNFREAVLEQRDKISGNQQASAAAPAAPDGSSLGEIHETLKRIEALLERRG